MLRNCVPLVFHKEILINFVNTSSNTFSSLSVISSNMREYARTLIEYIEYYLRFDGVQGDMVSPIIDEKLDQLGDVYYLAVYAGRKEIIGEINAYYRSLGVEEENLVDVGDKPHQVDTTLIPRKDTAQ